MPRLAAARLAIVCVVLVLVTLAAYRGLGRSAFIVFDDNGYVTENPHVKAGLAARSIGWAFTTGAQANWHPLTWLSHMVDVELFGLDAGRHHLTSLLLHAANAVLLLLALVRMTGSTWRSAFVAFLFAIHPLHVESVAWIAERKDVLSTLFWLLTLLAWLGWLETKTPARYALVLAMFACGLMAKPMLVTLPFTLLLFDFWPLRRGVRPLLLKEKAPLFAMAAVSCIVTFLVQNRVGAVQTLQSVTLIERVANAFSAYGWYLRKTLWPTSLSIFYPYPDHLSLMSWPVALSALLLTAITFAALRLAKRAPYLASGWLWYLGTLLPVIGLIQVGGQAMADRYTYVPLIGIFIAIVWGLGELTTKGDAARAAVVGVAVASLIALFAATRAQAAYWAGDIPLFTHAIEATSDNWLAHNNLGRGLFAEGRIDQAILEYQAALRISPGYADAHYNLGLAWAKTGKYPDAIERFEQALRLKPNFPEARNNLGGALADSGRVDAAIEQYELAMKLDPQNALAPYNLGNALFALGRFDEAVEQYRRSIALSPDRAEAHNNLGNALVKTGRVREAIEQYEQALLIDPGVATARDNLRSVRETMGPAR